MNGSRIIREGISLKVIWLGSLVFILGILAILFIFRGYENTWRLWNIPVSMPPFLDMQLIAKSSQSLHAGFDPSHENPYDPGSRYFNYPKIWYLLLNLKLTDESTIYFSVTSIALFFLSIAWLMSPKDFKTLFLLLAVTFSSAFMLAYERANVDLIFFVTTVYVIAVYPRRPWLSMLVLFISVLFKIFPIFMIGAFIQEEKTKRSILFPLIAIGFTVLYFLVTWQDMVFIFGHTQKGFDLSYGFAVLLSYLEKLSGQSFPVLRLTFMCISIGLLFLGLRVGFRNRCEVVEAGSINELRAFWAGAGIYVGTFLLGNNWDYRLIFTVLSVPGIVLLSKRGSPFTKSVSLITLMALLYSCWYLAIQGVCLGSPGCQLAMFLLDETANWFLFLGFVVLFSASLPKWVMETLLDFVRIIIPSRSSMPS